MDGSLRRLIKERLREFELEPTKRRVSQVHHCYHWYVHLNNCIEIDDMIQDMYRFRRIRNTRLAKKMVDQDKVLRYTDNWIYLRNY